MSGLVESGKTLLPSVRMSGDNSGSYAPRSPDLSSFLSAGPTAGHQEHSQQQHHSHYYQAHPPPPPTAAAHAHAQPTPPPFHLDNNSQSYHAQQQLHHQPNLYQRYDPVYEGSSTAAVPGYDYANYNPPVKPEYATYAPPASQAQPYLSPTAHHTYPPPQQPQQQLPRSLYELAPPHAYSGTHRQHYHQHSDRQTQYTASTEHTYPPSTSAATPVVKQEAADIKLNMPQKRGSAALAEEASIPVMESPVKTKFPTARIKRIMQADEEVGKVAQQTPIAVGKALELFMVQLVTKSADIAKDKGSKRVTASMLKHVVETDEQWDFLRDIVSKVENEKEGSKQKPKPESESEEEDAYEPKKRTRGRKKKSA
jgi:Dr1-associated corepressor